MVTRNLSYRGRKIRTTFSTTPAQDETKYRLFTELPRRAHLLILIYRSLGGLKPSKNKAIDRKSLFIERKLLWQAKTVKSHRVPHSS
jgi:hypothetical protein